MKRTSLVALIILATQLAGFSQETKTNQTSTVETYRDLKSEDGIQFGAYVADMKFSFDGQPPSGVLTKFGLVDSSGKFIELELVGKNFTTGHIKTKMFGDIIAKTSGPTSMSYAATESQIKKIHEFLSARAKIPTESDDLKMVKALLKDDPNYVFKKGKNGVTPLHGAAINGDKDVAELLLANKADANVEDDFSLTPLQYASENGYKEVVELLLANKADVNTTDRFNGVTPLIMAAANNHKDVAELLLANKAAINAKDHNGKTALFWASENGHKEVVELLLANKADVNTTNSFNRETPLIMAAGNNHKDVAELLLANKAEVNAKNQTGETPLYAAAYKGNKEMVELLLANKAEVNAKDQRGQTPLYVAAENGHKDVVEVLLANNADVNAKDDDGSTPLFLAAVNGYKDVAEVLRQHGGISTSGNSAWAKHSADKLFAETQANKIVDLIKAGDSVAAKRIVDSIQDESLKTMVRQNVGLALKQQELQK